MRVDIKANEHVFVCGATGTGKSYLSETYLGGFEYVVKLDTKQESYERYMDDESAWYGLDEGKDFDVCHSLEEAMESDFKKIIYTPDYSEINPDTMDEFFKWIYERGNTIVWIDELMSITSARTYPQQLKRCAIMGRSKGVGIWALTQRPSDIPTIVLANSRHFFMFDLSAPQDRKKMSDTTGCQEMLENPTGFNFWYASSNSRHATLARLSERG